MLLGGHALLHGVPLLNVCNSMLQSLQVLTPIPSPMLVLLSLDCPQHLSSFEMMSCHSHAAVQEMLCSTPAALMLTGRYNTGGLLASRVPENESIRLFLFLLQHRSAPSQLGSAPFQTRAVADPYPCRSWGLHTASMAETSQCMCSSCTVAVDNDIRQYE